MNNNVKQSQKIISFDSLRYILALIVLCGHLHIIFYRLIDNCSYHADALAVDGFFILSGFLLSKSCEKLLRNDLNDIDNFLSLVKRRFIRLWPEYFFASIIVLILSVFSTNNIVVNAIPLNLLFIGQINKIPTLIVGSWYIFVLFYIGAILSAIIILKKEVGKYIIIPIILLISLLIVTSTAGELTINGETFSKTIPMFSLGIIKGFLDLSLGIILFYVANYLANNPYKIKSMIKPYFLFALEIFSLFCVIYPLFQKSGESFSDFLVLVGYSIIITLLYLKKECILKFLSYKPLLKLANYSYMLYLTHFSVLYFIHSKIIYFNYPRYFIYVFFIVLCTIFACICKFCQVKLFWLFKNCMFESTQIKRKEGNE